MLAIIPARSGSKGVIDKNIKDLDGKPLLAYSIEAALKADIFDTVMVSTDSLRYADIAQEFGAEVPFLRSQKASSDIASTRECIIDVLDNYRIRGKTYEKFMILQPTSPLRKDQDIIEADKLYKDKNAKSVISVCEMSHSPLWSNTIGTSLSMKGFIDKEFDNRRQELESYYRINGAIYLHDVEHYLNNEYIYDDTCYAYIMSNSCSIDIDDNLDFIVAEAILSERKEICNNEF